MPKHKWGFLVPNVMFGFLILAGCSSTPQKPEEAIIFDKPAPAVQRAAIDSLVVNGFEIQKTEPLYVEGYRPRRVGLIVGSGGETVGVWLDPLNDSKTGVRVDTARTALGLAGQRNWNAEILSEMTKVLGKRD